jgi:hypothetical protein
MTTRIAASLLTTVALLSADTLVMRDGRKIDGSYVGGDNHSVSFAVRDRVQKFELQDVRSLEFNDNQGAYPTTSTAPPNGGYGRQQPYPPPQAYPQQQGSYSSGGYPPANNGQYSNPPGPSYPTAQNSPSYPSSPAPSSAAPSAFEVPAGSQIVVRLIDPVNSEVDRLGQTYRASVDQPVVVNGQTVIPRGADVIASLIDDQKSGKIQGKTVLTLDLKSVTVNNRTYGLVTTGVPQESGSRGERSAKVIGGTAALGAIIGAIAGGGKGAAIGAGSGAAVGTAAQVATGGQKVKVPAETRLTFTLQNPLSL